MNARDRVASLVSSFDEQDAGLHTTDPLVFEGYREQLDDARSDTGLDEACIWGWAEFSGATCALVVFDFLVVGQFDTKPKVKDGAMSDFATALMLDKAEISGTRITRDGYMVADVRAARSGIQQYAGHEVGKPDMAVVNVYRPEGEVFNKDSLASYAFKPVTINHPSTGVTADNWKQLSVGNVGAQPPPWV